MSVLPRSIPVPVSAPFRTVPAVVLVLSLALTACSADGPTPLPVDTAAGTSSVPPDPRFEERGEEVATSSLASEITIGIDPLDGGFNPHLISEDSAFVRALADLVLPSTHVNGRPNTDLVESVDFVEPSAPGVAQTVRYVLNPAAQWSDGAPITGADFSFLRDSMVSTPGVIGAAGYEQISAIRTSGGGRTIDVDFRRGVADISGLFNHLLPSHLLRDSADGFTTGLDHIIPAAGGRYTVARVDRQRGAVTLVRNDRFWGPDPAKTETLNFREVRSVQQGVQMLRSGQASYFDVTPEETTFDAFSLLPETRVSVRERETVLELTLSVTSPVLSTAAVRRELVGLIDRNQVARLATGRSTNLVIPDFPVSEPGDIGAGDFGDDGPEEDLNGDNKFSSADIGTVGPTLELATRSTPLRIAVDPADRMATAAANTIVDILRSKGINAEVVLAPFTDIAGKLLPAGDADAVVGHQRTTMDPVTLADRFLCPVALDPDDVTASTGSPNDVSSMSSRSRKRTSIRSGNLSGICSRKLDGTLLSMLAGTMNPEDVIPELRRVEQSEVLSIPLVTENRVIVLGPGIVVPDADIENWSANPGGITGLLSTAAGWTAKEE